MALSIEQHERLSEIEYILDEKASSPEAPYWFYDGETDYDEGMSLCYSCIMEIMPDAESGEHYGGGYGGVERDSCEHCEKCGKLLDYTLTNYGVDSELEHFIEYPPKNLDDADECYHLARIAHGVYTDKQKLKFLSIMRNLRVEIG